MINYILNNKTLIPLNTIMIREIMRFARIWTQTILPPLITTLLYFLIFGSLIGPRIGDMQGIAYVDYIAPGLIMMAIISNAYGNVSASFFSVRFQRSIEEMLVSSTPNYIIMLGFIMGGVARGICVGAVVTLVAMFFAHIKVHSIFIICSMVFLSSLLFSLAGFTNALFAKKFDDIAIIPTFILTPLTYLGGVFYSISLLPPFWQKVSVINPIVYLVNAFRYGFLGVSDVSIGMAFFIIILFIVSLFLLNLYLFNKGVGIRQ